VGHSCVGKRAVVIGGGLAGLSAAVALTDAGWQVTVLERGNTLGGRARSFTDPATGDVVDNGQHVFLGCYEQTLKFLRRLGTADQVKFQPSLEVAFAEPGRGMALLRCPRWSAPWHLVAGLAGLGTLSWRDKWAMGRVLRAAAGAAKDRAATDRLTVEAWLTALGQTPRSRQAFWDPLTIAALNEDPHRASALGLAQVLARMFGGDWRAARLGLASVGLSDLYTEQARQVIEQAGGVVRTNTAVAGIEGADGQASGVRLANGERLTADAYVSAVPPQECVRLLPPALLERDATLAKARQFTASPIVSINLWFDRPVTDALFLGLIGARVQWVFNRQRLLMHQPSRHLALVISAAAALVEQSNDVLVAMALEDLRACVPAVRQAQLLRSQVVREHHATVTLLPGSDAWRPGPTTAWPNLSIAGDWTATGLPATIESAVASGHAAASKMIAAPP